MLELHSADSLALSKDPTAVIWYYGDMCLQNSSPAILATLLICAVCGCFEPTQIDCQIVGHSMATAYKSKHTVATCDQCGFEFACDVVESDRLSVLCGNCGRQISSRLVSKPADKVKLNPGQSVRRWDVVAFRRGDRVLVKRVIGLPGEAVDFSAGNLLIDGKVTKTPERLWNKISSSVFDSRPSLSRPNSTQLSQRLVPRGEEAWDVSGTTISHHAMPATGDESREAEFDFLDYQHLRCYKSSEDAKTPAAIDDADPFNQSIRRTPHAVDELDVRVKATFAREGSIQIQRKMPQGTVSARVELRDHGVGILRLTKSDGEDIETVEQEIKVAEKSVEARLVNYDDLIHFFIDGREHVKPLRFESIENPKPFMVDASKPVVSIGVSREDSVAIEHFSVWRDWYLYQDTPMPSVKLPLDLGEGGYFVVGDNLPVSEDSRHFGQVHDIIGVVKPVDGN